MIIMQPLQSRLICSVPSTLPTGNCREALAVGKHALLTLLGSRVTSFKFFGTMAFFPQLPRLLFPLHWRHAAGWDLTLFPWVPGKAVPGEWVFGRNQHNVDGPQLIFGDKWWYLVLACSMFQTWNLLEKMPVCRAEIQSVDTCGAWRSDTHGQEGDEGTCAR